MSRAGHCGAPGSYDWVRPVVVRGRAVHVDTCIAPLVGALNEGGLHTVASCCGHGRQPGSVVLEDGRVLLVLAAGQEPGSTLAAVRLLRGLGLR